MSRKLEGLYVISDDTLTPKETLLSQVEESLKGGAKIVQLRDKLSRDEELESMILNLEMLCKRYEALFVLNDRINLAIKLNCSGLHIGKSDYAKIDFVRENFKGILGISCYKDVEKAFQMQEKGADYVAFGSFFPSPTKPQSEVVDKKVLTEAKNRLNIPICAIGGININNYSELKNKKTDMIAVVSDIWKSKNIQEKCELYVKGLK